MEYKFLNSIKFGYFLTSVGIGRITAAVTNFVTLISCICVSTSVYPSSVPSLLIRFVRIVAKSVCQLPNVRLPFLYVSALSLLDRFPRNLISKTYLKICR